MIPLKVNETLYYWWCYYKYSLNFAIQTTLIVKTGQSLKFFLVKVLLSNDAVKRQCLQNSVLKMLTSCNILDDHCNWDLGLPFRSQLINLLKKYHKKLAYTNYYKHYLWRNMCWVWKKKVTQHWFSFFQISRKY